MVLKFFRGVNGEAVRGSEGENPATYRCEPGRPISRYILLGGKNPMSVALTERPHESQDNYLLEKMHFYQMIRNTIAYSFIR